MAGYLIAVFTSNVKYCQNIQPLLAGAPCPSVDFFLEQENFLVIYVHAYWQLFTSIFVTDSIDDAFLNAIAVIILDLFLSNYFNRTRYFAVFFSSALLGNVLTLLQGPLYSSAGASGGIFGIFAASFSFIWVEQKRVDKTTLVLFAALFVASSFTSSNVNWVAHAGGSLGGFIAGPALYYSLRDKINSYSLDTSVSKYRGIFALLIALLIIGSIAQFLFFLLG
jgi:rhomboid protease GluP